VQELIRRYDGVLSTRVGYKGGANSHATYRNHDGHAEVVTEVVPAGEFWEAEPEHQDCLQRYPGGYSCHFVRPNWRLSSRTDKVAKEA
jgi:peptide methionine sulfoxide reductase MsrA